MFSLFLKLRIKQDKVLQFIEFYIEHVTFSRQIFKKQTSVFFVLKSLIFVSILCTVA